VGCDLSPDRRVSLPVKVSRQRVGDHGLFLSWRSCKSPPCSSRLRNLLYSLQFSGFKSRSATCHRLFASVLCPSS